MSNLTFSAAIPAISFEKVTGGARVRREGRGGSLLITQDTRAHDPRTHLIIRHGQGVVGRVSCIDGDWFVEDGVYRHWDRPGMFQVFPSSTVETLWGFATMTDAVAEMALRYIL
jgi:hypothetical protein